MCVSSWSHAGTDVSFPVLGIVSYPMLTLPDENISYSCCLRTPLGLMCAISKQQPKHRDMDGSGARRAWLDLVTQIPAFVRLSLT